MTTGDGPPTGGANGVAVILPGTGSTADFVTRAFGPPLAAAGLGLVAVEPEPGPRMVQAGFAALDEAVAGHDVRLVGGVSLGAHVAAQWAVARGPAGLALAGLLLALPAWTGPPGVVAAASAQVAGQIRAVGTAAVLAQTRQGAVPWVADELARAWPAYGPRLADTLEAAARSPGPTVDQLRRITVPVGLAAFTDDPLHPVEVAAEWAAALPCASLQRLTLADCAHDRSALGAAALSAWWRACHAATSPSGTGPAGGSGVRNA